MGLRRLGQRVGLVDLDLDGARADNLEELGRRLLQVRALGRELDDDPTPRLALLDALEEPPPFVPVVSKLLRLKELSVADFFRFERTPLAFAFLDAFEGLDTDGRPRCMIFQWPAVAKFACLHDLTPGRPPETLRNRKGKPVAGVRLQATLALGSLGEVALTLEPLEALLRRELDLPERNEGNDEEEACEDE